MKPVSIPLQLINLEDNGFHLLVEVVVFKQKYFAVVDTGASRTVFDKSFIEQHLGTSIDSVNEIDAATLFTTTSVVQITLPEFKIGAIKIKTYEAVAFDLQSVSETYQQLGHPPIVSIIGGDILVKYKAHINYNKLILKLYR